MTDIAERLHTYLASELDTSDDAAREHDTMIAEAADEIERLRDDNKTLQVALDFSVENDKIAADEIERLRTALTYHVNELREARREIDRLRGAA